MEQALGCGGGRGNRLHLAANGMQRSAQQWRDLVAGVVNRTRGAEARLTGEQAVDSLRTHLAGGLTVDPLYVRPQDARPLGVPGAMPFTRGRTMRTSWAFIPKRCS